MRAHTRVLAALRETQLEHHAELKGDIAELRTELKGDIAELKVGLTHIVRLLEGPGGGSGDREH